MSRIVRTFSRVRPNQAIYFPRKRRLIPGRFFNVPRRDEQGRIDDLIGYFRDVTERRQAEAELSRLASFPELNPNPILEISLTGRIEYINSIAQKLFPDLIRKTEDHAYFTGWAEIVERFQHDPTLVISRDIQVEGRYYQQSIFYVNKYDRLRVYGIDITQHKQAEEALHESEERFRTLFEQAAVGVALLETKTGRYIRINQKYCDFLGYTMQEMLDISFQDVTYPDDQQENLDNNALLMQGKIKEFTIEKRYVRKDGEFVWGTLTASPLWKPGETPDKYIHIAVVQDITRRKQAEEALRKSEERYHSLFNGMTEGFALHEIICDENGQPCDYRFLEMNPAFERLTGHKRSELEGQLKSAVMPGDGPYWVEVYGKVALTGQPVHYENYSSALDRYYEVDSYCPATGQFAVILRNVTERKKTQERILLQAHMLAAVGQGVVAVDLVGKITYWNRAAALQYGWQADEILGRGLAEIILPEDHTPRERFEQIMTAMTSGEKWSSEITVKRRNGSLFPALVTFAPIKEESSPMTGVIGVFTDLSERHLAEESLRQSEQKYRTLFETMTQGIMYLDTEGNVISANPAVLRILQMTLDELKGRMSIDSIWQAFREDGSPFPPKQHPIAVALANGKPVQNVVIGYSHPNTGEITWIKMDAVPQFQLGESLPYQVYVVLDDITTRKNIEAERDRALDEAQRRAAELDAVFNSIADGVMLIGSSGEILSLNPAAQRIFDYSPEQYKLSLNQRALITQPDTADGQPLAEESDFPVTRALRGETVRNMVLMITPPKSGRRTWISLSAAPLHAGKDIGAVLSFTDVSERMEMEDELRRARDELEARVQERTAELTSILTALRESEERFRQLAENIREVFVLFTPGEFQPFYVSPAYAELVGRPPESLYEDPHSFLDTIYAEDRPDVGTLLNMINQGKFDRQYRMVRQDGDLRWVRARGFPVRNKQGELYRVAAIIEDVTSEVEAYQLLEQRVEERTRELTTLLSYSEKLASTLELKPLLRIMLEQLYSVADYDGAAVMLLEGDELVAVEYEGPVPEDEILNIHFPKSVSTALSRVIETRAPVIISDLQGDSEEARQFRQASLPQNRFLLGQARAWMGVPLIVKNQLVGVLRLSHTQPDHFTQRQAQLVTAIANQAAMAIENAQLYDQARQLAALGERQRLARELHDSVSQALYGISLGTHTAIALTRRDPQKLDDVLKYILSLAEAALIEMRALIFELRPDSLETEGLVWALDRQAKALQARRGVSVKTNLCDEIKTPIEVKEALYRIAQEAMQNAIKHANPSEIYLELSCSEHFVELVVVNNGSGFDPNQSFPGHLGLRSMSERATWLGGSLVIDSAPGKGTRIQVKLPL